MGTSVVADPRDRFFRTLLFDVRGVLYDDSAWQRWLLQLVHRMGVFTTYNAFFHLFEREYLPCGVQVEDDYWHALQNYLRAVGLSCGQVDEILAAGRARRVLLADKVRLLPGVRPALTQLAALGLQLGVLCTSSLRRSDLEGRLSELGLSSLLNPVLTQTEWIQSSHTLFGHASAALRADPQHIGFVSRDAVELLNAADAGFEPISFGSTAPPRCTVYRLEHFSELVDVVRSQGEQHQAS